MSQDAKTGRARIGVRFLSTPDRGLVVCGTVESRGREIHSSRQLKYKDDSTANQARIEADSWLRTGI